jgi:hypothetical protein
MFLEEGEVRFRGGSLSAGESFTLLVCLIFILLLGLFPQLLYTYIKL